MINDRRQLADVYQQTIDIVLEGHYTSENGEKVKLPDNTKMLKGSRFYTKPLDASNIPPLAEGSTKIIVKNDDSIHCGHLLQQEGYNPVVLNLASRRNPGGGVKNGSRAQEESLFRSTNLFLSMYRYAEYAEDYGLEKSKFQYPMPVRFGGIYVPYATVFRAGAKDNFALLDTPYYMSFVAVAAINHPDLDRDGNICEEDAALTKNKMRTMLRIGLLNGHDSIVLGAFGAVPSTILRNISQDCFTKSSTRRSSWTSTSSSPSPSLKTITRQEVETCNPSSRNSSHKLPQIWLSLRPPIFNSQIHTDGA